MLVAARMELDEGRVCMMKVCDNYYQVKNRDHSKVYDIFINKPSCSCPYYTHKKMLCKHIFLLLESNNIKWQDFPEKFRNQSQMVIDTDAIEHPFCGKLNTKEELQHHQQDIIDNKSDDIANKH